jgi:hypothetical protein
MKRAIQIRSFSVMMLLLVAAGVLGKFKPLGFFSGL